jgi:hypothetical protein
MPTNKKQPVPHVQAPRVYQKPEDMFRAEKDRSTSAARSHHAKLLAEAKAAFDKLMAEGQAARKSGRPRKHPLPPLKTGSAATPGANRPIQPFAFVRPSDFAAGVASPPATPDMLIAARAKAKAKPASKPKAKAKSKPKAKGKAKKKK